jgi:hypothetical protein
MEVNFGYGIEIVDTVDGVNVYTIYTLSTIGRNNALSMCL